jgi:hypothetical protein
MMKAHCDNCDQVILDDAKASRRVSVQPHGYQCEVDVTIRKQAGPSKLGADQALCASCLRAAVIAFVESLPAATVGWGDTREKAE